MYERANTICRHLTNQRTPNMLGINFNQTSAVASDGTHAFGRFSNKTIAITGGAGNIGKAVALRFASEKANVVILDLAHTNIKSAVDEINQAGGVGLGIVCDVTDLTSIDDALQTIVEKFGGVDYCFNNAGYQGLFKQTHEYPLDDFKRVVEINVVGVFNILQRFSEHMKDNGGGVFVNTASMAGVLGPPNMIAYGASKFAVVGMTLTAAKDLAPFNIRVNCISPAFIGPGFMWDRQVELQAGVGSQYYSTDPKVVAEQMISSTAMRRYGSLEEVASSVAFLMSDDASYLTGINIEIHGGHPA
eukprot:TRINITY_DN1136_c1_g1_i2.p1 TRINITY_DN1136_c1_g1~~TRINITY_DN1136_c1_g1_i2.p1  ORF type:complete len:303 (+),score=66.40 TRINITY_DN1136_c1_g1_i2:32-940(+)